jgi:hypothetical protein
MDDCNYQNFTLHWVLEEISLSAYKREHSRSCSCTWMFYHKHWTMNAETHSEVLKWENEVFSELYSARRR